MANGILDFFSREAGQQWRKALDEAVEYYVPPNLRGLLGFAAEMTPTRGIERAGQASQKLFAPDTPGWERVSALGDMASEIAGVVAPAAVAGKVGMPAAQALQEGLMGFSTSPQGAALRNFAGDESGALRLFQGSPHDFNAERLVRMPDGSTQYIVGRPDVLPDIPPGAEVLRDFPLGRMRLDKIGTGEGVQAYGHGLYVAENEGVARGYRDALSDKPTVVDAAVRRYGGIDGAIEAMQNRIKEYESGFYADPFGLELAKKRLQQLQRAKAGSLNTGRIYEVNVNANPEDFLDWDKPLSGGELWNIGDVFSGGMSPEMEELSDMFKYQTLPGEMTGRQARQWIGATLEQGRVPEGVFSDPEGKFAASTDKYLREAGFPGIRYLDAGSRGAGEGSRNYVVFDDKLIDIVRKYGIAGAAAMLGVNAIDVEQAMAQGRPQPQGLLGYGVQ